MTKVLSSWSWRAGLYFVLYLKMFSPILLVQTCIAVRTDVLLYTDKKENQIFLIDKEIQSGVVAKSYMRKGYANYMRKI